MTAGRWKNVGICLRVFSFIQIIFVESRQKARNLFDPR